MSSHVLRVIWPILDPTTPLEQIADEVRADLPAIAARAHAVPEGPPRFWVAPASRVPGSGGITRLVLLCELPARAAEARIYHTRRTG